MLKKLIVASSLLSIFGAVAQDNEKAFKMDGEFGLIVATGNTETTTVTGGLSARHNLDNWQNDYLIEGLYREETVVNEGVEEDRVSAQKFFASAQGNYKLDNPNNRLFGFASYEDDRLGAFKYQATIAGGWNQTVWKSSTSSFEYSVGPGYAFQEEQDGTDANTFVVRGNLIYKWFISDTATFTQNIATEVGSSNTKSRAETALTAKINGSLSMKASIRLDHNTQVASNLENLDTETALTLVYSFF